MGRPAVSAHEPVAPGGGEPARALPHGVAHESGVDPYRVSRRSGGLLSTLFIAIVVAAGLSLIPLPYVVLQPGPIFNTLGELDGQPIVKVQGARPYPAKGALDFTTVRVVGGPGVRVNAFDLGLAAIREDREDLVVVVVVAQAGIQLGRS